MPTKQFAPLLGKRIRATRLDDCGNVPEAATANSNVVTDGFVSISLSAEVEEGTEIIQRKADGSLCVNEKFSDSFKRFTVEIEFCGVNGSVLDFVSNAKPYSDWAGNVAGFTVPEGAITKKFALELWTGLSGVACVPGQSTAGGYLLLPFVQAGIVGDIEINGEDTVTFSMTGAYTKGGNAWGVGPYKPVLGGTMTNEVQTITITGTPTGGTFTLTWNGQTTSAIAYNATAAAVQTALENLSNLVPGQVTVTGGPGPGTPYQVTFTGSLAATNVAQITATGSFTGGTSPAITVTTPTPGVPGVASSLPTPLDPLDHLLLIDTAVAPPPSATDPQAMPA